jgi:hypothetical protein
MLSPFKNKRETQGQKQQKFVKVDNSRPSRETVKLLSPSTVVVDDDVDREIVNKIKK